MWYYWLTDIRFYSPWKLSYYAVVIQAENREQAIEIINNIAQEWCEDMRLSQLCNCSFAFNTEKEARGHAIREYAKFSIKKVPA